MTISWSEFEPGAKGSVEQDSLQPAHPAAVLVELYGLLEAYGPIWYTEELHDRVFAALRILLDDLYREKPSII